MKLICLGSIFMIFMYQIWKGCCAPSWNSGLVDFGGKLDRMLPEPERRTPEHRIKTKSGPSPGAWLYIMGHNGSKRSVEVQNERSVEYPELADTFQAYPKWGDKMETLRLLNSFLHFMDFKVGYHSLQNFLQAAEKEKREQEDV